ncbi:DUF2157 domain-containing protein [Fischerella muscicola CCMEE 5323]|uniref:DUF2157 domain-containing protein n=1 Tax=Fischerella muscicola CCMEE 5323 TaxID=2019572 RepID=A0A2N6K2D5_FISMU|nr:DUF2157 domain-containing protein [Fischerella muscicola]PLZ89144.1 DUF2157 domain-containing protein [Fischerella muscicola CCMEE 5323]
MSSPLDRPLKIEIRLPSYHPQLLQGLDTWLRLGLISDAQVRQLCREYLVCKVVLESQIQPEPEKATVTSTSVEPVTASRLQPPPEPVKPNFATEILQSLLSELSVRWLLFLGVFLVVLSSGVLAASQWERFPASGQYGVLFAYTLSFGGMSLWTAKQSNLRLTAQTLLIVTLLLVPINFWAMDRFGLWQNLVNWIVVAIASICLTAITVLIGKSRLFAANLANQKLFLINILGLSYLHWGWNLPTFPLIALYLAVVGTTLITVYQTRLLSRQTDRQSGNGISLSALVVVYALLVLLVRGIFIQHLDVRQLGLAVGICGSLLTWLAQQQVNRHRSFILIDREVGRLGDGENSTHHPITPSPHHPTSTLPWQLIGGILLFLGWLVSVASHPGQAIAVSGLGLWFFARRLQLYNYKRDFVAIFAIGLQAIWLGWRLVPDALQQRVIATATQLTNSQNEAWALLSIALFPYVILMVVLTDKLHHVGRREIAKFGEKLTLGFASALTVIALVNPALRSLNLILSTITLAVVTQRRPTPPTSPTLIYLTHITGVLTLCSIIDWLFPNLNNEIWATILLVMMVAEWLFSLGEGWWRRSAWYIGLGLAVISFYLFWVNAESAWRNYAVNNASWGIAWLITPLTLTGVASRSSGERRNLSVILSVIGLGIIQLLTLPLARVRLIALAVAAALMFVNTSFLRHKTYAVITVGFVLSAIAALLWEGVPGLPNLSAQGWFVVGAITILGLWLTRTALQHRGNELASIYKVATDRWAIALTGVELLSLTLHSVWVYQRIATPGLLYVVANVIILAAIIYRSWRQPTNSAFYGIGWCLELLIAELLAFGDRSIMQIAIANIALGLFSQLFGEWWQRRHRLERLPSSFHILPLIYTGFSLLLRLNTFTEWTGLASLSVAVIVIGVGRRRQEFKPLVYLGILGISISAYELLFYQMLQAAGGAWGDGLIAMSALGTTIMYAYRILSPWLVNYLRLTPQELKVIAHLHWAWSSFLLIVAITAPIQVNRLLGLGTGIFLIRYAIFQGRFPQHRENNSNFASVVTPDEIWVYLGLLEVAAMRIFWRETAVGQWFAGPLVPWNAAIACIVAYFLYILPWETWGWSKRPWQRAAYIIPLILLWETRLQIHPIALLLTAGFYAFLGIFSNQFRVTYISVALIDWAIFRWFAVLGLNDSLWYVTVIGLSLLYVAQFDPQLRQPDMKASRHYWRLLSSGLICGWAILFHQDTALIPGIFSLIAIFAGLGLRVRAFLYVGTATFLITAFYQLVLFSLRYSFFKWIIGLVVGIIFISIAANFETHRAQLNSLLRNTSDKFQDWQ